MARELGFSQEEVNSIRQENPDSLTAQSFTLLKKWVHRDGRHATSELSSESKIQRCEIFIKDIKDATINSTLAKRRHCTNYYNNTHHSSLENIQFTINLNEVVEIVEEQCLGLLGH